MFSNGQTFYSRDLLHINKERLHAPVFKLSAQLNKTGIKQKHKRCLLLFYFSFILIVRTTLCI